MKERMNECDKAVQYENEHRTHSLSGTSMINIIFFFYLPLLCREIPIEVNVCVFMHKRACVHVCIVHGCSTDVFCVICIFILAERCWHAAFVLIFSLRSQCRIGNTEEGGISVKTDFISRISEGECAPFCLCHVFTLEYLTLSINVCVCTHVCIYIYVCVYV
jgi:hypothetical protein